MRKISAATFLLFFAFAMLLLSSCQKEPSTNNSSESCLLVKTHYFNYAGSLADSLEYTYNNNKLTKASNADGYITFEYTNDKITKRNFYTTGVPESDAYDIATYNADGTLAIIKSYFEFNGQIIQSEQYEFSYANGKLVNFDLKEYDYSTSQLELSESSTYTYTGNNITKAIVTDFTISGGDVGTYNYSYDSNENYFAKNNALLTDYMFFEAPDGSTLPLVISTNNVKNVFDDSGEFPISYKLDSKNNFHEFYLDGELASRYFYDCK